MNSDSRKRLLIVDDEPSMRMLLKLLFEDDEELDLMIAEDGKQALERVRDVKPDLILLDVMMPGIDGFAVCRGIRDLYGDAIYVLMFTGLAGPEAEQSALEAGANLYMNKPLDLPKLYDIVKQNIQ